MGDTREQLLRWRRGFELAAMADRLCRRAEGPDPKRAAERSLPLINLALRNALDPVIAEHRERADREVRETWARLRAYFA